MYLMGYCYLCEKEWTGYWGDYFCADCANLKKVVLVVGSKKITDNIKWNTKKIEIDTSDCEEQTEMKTYNTRSKSR